MSSKRQNEKDIKNFTRQIFRQINKYKEYVMIILLGIFTYLIFQKPNVEKVLIYIISIICIQKVINKDIELKKISKANKKISLKS